MTGSRLSSPRRNKIARTRKGRRLLCTCTQLFLSQPVCPVQRTDCVSAMAFAPRHPCSKDKGEGKGSHVERFFHLLAFFAFVPFLSSLCPRLFFPSCPIPLPTLLLSCFWDARTFIRSTLSLPPHPLSPPSSPRQPLAVMSSPPVTPPTLRGPSGVGGGGGFLSFATRLTTTTTTTMTNNSIVHETMSEPAYGRSLQFPPETAFSRDQGGVREQDDFLSQQQLQQLQYQQVGLSQPQQEPLWLQEQHQHELPQLSIESNPALTMPEKVLKERRDAELQAANAIHNAKVQAIDLKYTRELLSMRAQLQNQNALYTTPIGLGQTTGRRAGTPVAGALQVLCRSALTALSATAVNPQIGLSPVRTVNGRGEQSNPSIMDTVPMPPPPQSQSQYPVAGAIALASSPPPPTPTSILSSFPERTEESRGPAALSKPTLKPMDEIPEGKHANPSSYTVIGKRYAWTPELLGSGRYARVFGCLDLQNGSRKLVRTPSLMYSFASPFVALRRTLTVFNVRVGYADCHEAQGEKRNSP